MSEKSLDAILGDFNPGESPAKGNLQGGTLTIWLSPEYKAKYDNLQRVSNRRFIKKVREIIQAAIDRTETRAS